MMHIRLVATLLILVTAASAQDKPPADEGWITLFNGKDLTGWTPKIKGYPLGENFGNTFRVADGVLQVGYEKYEKFNRRFGHIFYKTEYSHYRLKLEYRFTGEQVPGGPGWAFRNSGIMAHGQSAKSMKKDQDFPVSIEVQLLGGPGKGERATGNLSTPAPTSSWPASWSGVTAPTPSPRPTTEISGLPASLRSAATTSFATPSTARSSSSTASPN